MQNISKKIEPSADADLSTEWDLSHEHARNMVLDNLRRLEVSPKAIEHVSGLRLYYRVCFLLASWGTSKDQRKSISAALAAHIVSMKLLDDLIDDDSGVERADLGVSSLQLLLRATEILTGCDRGIALVLADNFDRICHGQLKCKHQPAKNFEQWLNFADEYGARFLAVYGKVGGLACGLGDQSTVPETFASAFGMIITIADDLTDYTRHGERVGNLGAMLLDGAVTVDAITARLEKERERAHLAAKALPHPFNLSPIVDTYVNDVLERLLPRFSGSGA